MHCHCWCSWMFSSINVQHVLSHVRARVDQLCRSQGIIWVLMTVLWYMVVTLLQGSTSKYVTSSIATMQLCATNRFLVHLWRCGILFIHAGTLLSIFSTIPLMHNTHLAHCDRFRFVLVMVIGLLVVSMYMLSTIPRQGIIRCCDDCASVRAFIVKTLGWSFNEENRK